EKAYDCRYGENPHQQGAFYIERGATAGSMALAESLGAGGKELSFNNIVDIDATLDAVREFTEQPAAVVVKHTNPAGVAVAEDLETAFRTARAADPVSAFGGIVALNREVDEATAKAVTESFIECIIAPAFAGGALDVLILATGEMLGADRGGVTFKRVDGGVVVHERDGSGIGEVRAGRVATKRAPTDAEMRALDFAWRVCKHVKSNAIVFAHEDRTVGVGAGQMSRVVSVELAAKQAGDKSKGAVMASDAFFPFADGIEAAIAAGVTAVCQPGGSKRDDEVIAAADAAGIAMVLTGIRHFRH
ncbi:MAG: bifunctional phosphoribosylaminoimidazolecarboxamide formyltransferase/IMP cyclohydrolase, partial [Deltaproteobacteria bacterium]|nr:bifunctional phosphoribosylaminoimidazolecarboxamide formyltransferase/IMP cyclohydrolase [Deltaproteobacteria bacterium]